MLGHINPEEFFVHHPKIFLLIIGCAWVYSFYEGWAEYLFFLFLWAGIPIIFILSLYKRFIGAYIKIAMLIIGLFCLYHSPKYIMDIPYAFNPPEITLQSCLVDVKSRAFISTSSGRRGSNRTYGEALLFHKYFLNCENKDGKKYHHEISSRLNDKATSKSLVIKYLPHTDIILDIKSNL